MRKRIFLQLIFITIVLYGFCIIPVLGIEYELGVSKNDSFIWEVESFDESAYESYFSEKADFKEGVSKKYDITKISEKSKYWEITFDKWDYTKDLDKFADEADEEVEQRIYQDAEEQSENLFTIEEILEMWVIPTPAADYLYEYGTEFDSDIINIYIEDTTLSVKYAFEHVEWEAELIYTLDGVVETIRYIESDGDVFVKISLSRETVPNYPLPLIVFCILTPITIIIFKILKVRKLNINST